MQCMSNENIGCKNSFEEGNEADQSYEESYCSISNSIEKVPQTSILESISTLQRKDIEVVVPDEVDLVDAQISWDIGKILGLQVSNEKAMIAALAKVQECQDFILLRKRDAPGRTKALLTIEGFVFSICVCNSFVWWGG